MLVQVFDRPRAPRKVQRRRGTCQHRRLGLPPKTNPRLLLFALFCAIIVFSHVLLTCGGASPVFAHVPMSVNKHGSRRTCVFPCKSCVCSFPGSLCMLGSSGRPTGTIWDVPERKTDPITKKYATLKPCERPPYEAPFSYGFRIRSGIRSNKNKGTVTGNMIDLLDLTPRDLACNWWFRGVRGVRVQVTPTVNKQK